MSVNLHERRWLLTQRIAKARSAPGVEKSNARVDKCADGAENHTMEARITALEKDLAVVKLDVAVIRSNYATKQELSVVAQDVAVIRSNYVTREELQKELHALTWKMYGFGTLLTAAVYFIARYVH